MPIRLAPLVLVLLWVQSLAAKPPSGSFQFDFDPHATYTFGGVVGERISANNTGWLIRAPAANPGLLAMFRLRDRQPPPDIMPWAGEFVGKFLISAVQARRMMDDPKLDAVVETVVQELIACQAQDGYLGPFPKNERLLKHWDLWGHYHVMLALLMWHEQTGDTAALDACRKAADLICRTYLDTDRRPRDAGSTEMNLAIIHSLGRLHRVTGEDRYFRMMRLIEKDWEQEGDYYRTGLAGVPFYRTPKPRWESLHNLQGLVELYRITNDNRYRQAFLSHWQSIRRFDRRNTGGFSSSEKATGSPYEPTPIETCCTIAWMAMTVDALRLTGDSLAADELERSTYNGMLGAQHPSGSWWTYNTPMNGIREAAHDTIVFQARAGTPELNCCSVNAPRGFGMLSEWAVQRADDGLVVNYYGPMEAHVALADGLPVEIRQQTSYPLAGTVRISVHPREPREFALRLRIPGWSSGTKVQLPQQEEVDGRSGTYCTIRRKWKPGDVVSLELDMPLRYEAGGGEMAGRMSLYRGPLLLAYDVLQNGQGGADPPALAPSSFANARVTVPAHHAGRSPIGHDAPWILVELPRLDDGIVRLCDFASAGARGSRYASWLPSKELVPPMPVSEYPANGQSVPAGAMLFTVRGVLHQDQGPSAHIVIAQDDSFQRPVLELDAGTARRVIVPENKTQGLKQDIDYYWKVVARNGWGTTESLPPALRFQIDSSLPPLGDDVLSEYGENEGGLVMQANLLGDPAPSYGEAGISRGWKRAPGPGGRAGQAVELDGLTGMLVYKLRAFPRRDYTVSLWFASKQEPGRLGQLFSAWCDGMDDPLRICIERGKLSARIEAGVGYATEGVPIDNGTWYHVCVVKRENKLVLYLNGRQVADTRVPVEFHSSARDFALGANPHFTGTNEHLACRVARLSVIVRALSDDEVAELARKRHQGEP